MFIELVEAARFSCMDTLWEQAVELQLVGWAVVTPLCSRYGSSRKSFAVILTVTAATCSSVKFLLHRVPSFPQRQIVFQVRCRTVDSSRKVLRKMKSAWSARLEDDCEAGIVEYR